VANEEHLAQLKNGVEHWNQWRKDQKALIDLRDIDLSGTQLRGSNFSGADFSNARLRDASLLYADFSSAQLHNVDLRGSDLRGADFRYANLSNADLSSADIGGADFSGTNLKFANLSNLNSDEAVIFHNTDLSNANLSRAYLERTNLSGVNFNRADLSNASFYGANLSGALLQHANLSGADFTKAILANATLMYAILNYTDLSSADLSDVMFLGADLSNAFLRGAQLLRSDLRYSILTGACIQDWNINVETQLDGVKCDFVYLKESLSLEENSFFLYDRRPRHPDNIFAPGEFAKLFQKVLETVDLIFVDGIDWNAFFHSLQELRSQYNDHNLSIQAIEKKSGGAFVIRLEVPPDVDTGIIESRAKELYDEKLKLLEARVTDYKDEVKFLRLSNASLEKVLEIMANNQPTNQTTIHGSNFGFIQSGSGEISHFEQNIGQNADEVIRLITALREQAQQLPKEQCDAANISLGDLEDDLRKPNVEPKRIKQRLIALLMILSVIGTTIATATDFANNVFELADKLGISKLELLKHVPMNLLS
jgi:uncharacterized protein YjbI with pentapeptide repeats